MWSWGPAMLHSRYGRWEVGRRAHLVLGVKEWVEGEQNHKETPEDNSLLILRGIISKLYQLWLFFFLPQSTFTRVPAIKKKAMESSHSGSAVMNQTSIYEYAGLIPGLAQWVKDLELLRAVV